MDITRLAAGTSPMHRLNPLTKLVFAVSVTVCAYGLTAAWWPLLLFCCVVVPLVVLSGTLGTFLRMLLALWVPVTVVMFLVQGFFYPGAQHVVAGLGPLHLSSEGLVFAAQTTLRVLVLLGGFFFLLLTTHPGVLMSAMTQRGMSPKIVYVVSAALQIVPALTARAQGILNAQQARGQAVKGLRGRSRAILPMAGPLILGAITDVEERAAAMETRGFGAERHPTTLTEVPDSTAQRTARAVLWLCAAAAVTVNVLGVIR